MIWTFNPRRNDLIPLGHPTGARSLLACVGRWRAVWPPHRGHTAIVRRTVLACFLCSLGCRASHPTQPSLSPPVFTPDGLSIVFSTTNGENCFLYKAYNSNGLMHRLTHADSGCEFDPSLSPYGQSVACMAA